MKSKEILQIMDEKRALFGMFFAFQNRLQAVGDTFYDDITSKQFFLMACLCLYSNEGPTAQELADTMGCSHQNVKQMLLKLENNGYVVLKTDASDRRKLRIYASKKAEELAEQNSLRTEEFLTNLYAGLDTKQLRDTYLTLSKLEDNLKRIKEMQNQKET